MAGIARRIRVPTRVSREERDGGERLPGRWRPDPPRGRADLSLDASYNVNDAPGSSRVTFMPSKA